MIIGAPSPSNRPHEVRQLPAADVARSAAPRACGAVGGAPLALREPRVNLPEGTRFEKLKNHQKRDLSKLADGVFNALAVNKLIDGLKRDAWRQRESIAACGRRISEAEQRDYNTIAAHFQALAKQAGKAFASLMRDATHDYRIAMHKLREELKANALHESYAAAIAKNKFKGIALEHCTAKQLWVLVYDLRRIFTQKNQHKLAAKRAAKAAKASPPQPIADDEENPF